MEELKASQDHDRSQSVIQSWKATQDHNVGDRPFKANQDYKMFFASSFGPCHWMAEHQPYDLVWGFIVHD